MSGICGIFHRDGAPVDPATLSAMLAVTPFRGPDGVRSWVGGQIGLGHQLFATTPEPPDHNQPSPGGDAGVVVTLDGRIDNRRELIRELGLTGAAGELCDASLVRLAYERWHEDCCVRLIGDFAFALWDGARRQLFAARDTAGIKPFYYFAGMRCFVFGSESCQVLAHPAVSRRVNEGMVAEHLAVAVTSRDETLFSDVQRLPPAHCLRVDADRCLVRPYWEPVPDARIRYRGFEEYLDHFLELLRRAVADRLDCIGDPGVMLSGGLDSTAVAGMAQSILSQRGQPPLRTFSATLPGRADDEGPYIDSVVDMWGLRAHRMAYRPVPEPDWTAEVAETLEPPDNPGIVASRPLRAMPAAHSVRVLLTGLGAEPWLEGNSYPYWDMLGRWDLRAVLQEFAHQRSRLGTRYALSRVVRSLLWPLLPAAARTWMERSRSRVRNLPSPFLDPAFARRVRLDERLHRYDCGGRFSNLACWEQQRAANYGYYPLELEFDDRADARFGIESRHPLYDRRLVEFLACVPADVRRSTGHDKLLLRRSGLHPPSVAWRRDGSDYSFAFDHTFASPTFAETLSGVAIAGEGWVQGTPVAAALERYRSGGDPPSRRFALMWSLWMVFSVEVWYKAAVVETSPAPSDRDP